jgi:hypothetical protein
MCCGPPAQARRKSRSTALAAATIPQAMHSGAFRKLLREWAALVAVLALVLGPLALGVGRSLGAAEKVAIAAGMKPPALCLPGGGDGGSGAGGPDCDHCTTLQPCAPPLPGDASVKIRMAEGALFPTTVGTLSAFPRAPPARGPPLA